MDAGQASEKMGAERPFERMEDEGVPKADAPSEQVAKPTPAEDKKLSPADYRVYNRMAEHMDMFVRSSPQPLPCFQRHITQGRPVRQNHR